MKAQNLLSLLATAASITTSTAQVIKNANGTYTCALSSGSYCASSSLTSNLIIRCNDHIGTVSNCDTRLASKLPTGEQYSPCWQTSVIAGNAACTKNGIVYPDGNNTTPYPVPNYQLLAASVSSVATASSTATSWPYSSVSGLGNLTTSTTTSTSTRTKTVTTTITVVPAANSTAIYNNATANANVAATTTTSAPYLPYLPAPVQATSTQYTTDIISLYTTICPAGLTITASGQETVLATPTTITLTTTSRSTITATAIVSGEPFFAFNFVASASASASSKVQSSVVAAAVTSVAAPYVFTNATTLSIVGTAAPSASASAAAWPAWNSTTVTPYTGAASSNSKNGLASLALAVVALVILI